MSKKKTKEKLQIIPLGGVELIGMNMTAFCYGDSIIVVDCGMAFPEDDMPGVDLVIPDISFLNAVDIWLPTASDYPNPRRPRCYDRPTQDWYADDDIAPTPPDNDEAKA